MDTDGDGFVSRDEYLLGAKDAMNHDPAGADMNIRRKVYDFVAHLFDVSDVDEDGMLNAAEMEFGEHLAAMGWPEDEEEDTFDFGLRYAQWVMSKLDVDENNGIDVREFEDGWRSTFENLGWDQRRLDEPLLASMMQDIFVKADIRHDGMLELREMQFAALCITEFAVQQVVKAIFRDLDKNDDGIIGDEEVALAARGRDPEGLVAQLHERFREFDLNGDGHLDERETRVIAGWIIRGDA